MHIEASSFDFDIIGAKAGMSGEVHSLYKSAITLNFTGTMITILPVERGEGPGFVLISPECEFPERTLLKPGDWVKVDEDCSRITTRALNVSLEKAKRFSSLSPFYTDGKDAAFIDSYRDIKKFQDMRGTEMDREGEEPCKKKFVRLIADYFLKGDNVGNSLLSRVIPALRTASLKCCIGSCVLSVWQETADSILTDLRNSIKNRNGEMFGKTLKRLVGMGWGLTPGGDDFILGMLGFTSFILKNCPQNLDKDEKTDFYETLSFVNLQIRNHLPGFLKKTGFISASYLKYALEGRYAASFTDFLKSLKKDNINELETSLAKLTEYGATSGMDIAAGVIFLKNQGQLPYFV